MAEHIVVGGRRKNPVIEKWNYSTTLAEERAHQCLIEMKALLMDSAPQEKKAEIPLHFFRDVSQ